MKKSELNMLVEYLFDNYTGRDKIFNIWNNKNRDCLNDSSQKLGPANNNKHLDLFIVAIDYGEIVEGSIDLNNLPELDIEKWKVDSRSEEDTYMKGKRVLDRNSEESRRLMRNRKIKSGIDPEDKWTINNPTRSIIVPSEKYGNICVPLESLKDWKNEYPNWEFEQYYEFKMITTKMGV